MTILNFAINNIVRDKWRYINHYINCVFSILSFFVFFVLYNHPSLTFVGTRSALGLILLGSGVITVGFSFFFITYSVLSYLKFRNRQFGIITILGASKKQINLLIFYENILLGLISLLSAVIIGIGISKFVLLLASKVISGIDLYYYLPIKALIGTVIVFGLVFLIIATLAPLFIRKQKIITLVKSEEKGEKPQKFILISIIFVVTTTFSIWVYFSGSAITEGLIDSQLPLIPLGISVLIGIYLLLSIAIKIIVGILKTKGYYYKGTNLVFFSDLIGRIKSESMVMTVTTCLYVIAFTSIVVSMNSSQNVAQETAELHPFAVQYIPWSTDIDVNADVHTIRKELQGFDGYKEIEMDIYEVPSSSYPRFGIMSEKAYNEVMEFLNRNPIQLASDEVFLVSGDPRTVPSQVPDIVTQLLDKSGIRYKIGGSTNKGITMSGYYAGMTVLQDDMFAKVIPNINRQTVYAFDYTDKLTNGGAEPKLRELSEERIATRDASLITFYDHYRMNQDIAEMILFISLDLCAVFVIAAASLNYSRLYSTLDKDAARLLRIVKIGMSKRDLSKVLSKLIRLLLFTPFLLAVVFMWIVVLLLEQRVIISLLPYSIRFTFILFVTQPMLYTVVNRVYKKKMFEAIYTNIR